MARCAPAAQFGDAIVTRMLLLLLALTWAAGGSALAHRPYFTQVAPIVLPDGQPGEMRLLHGDGIIFADPVRILVLNQEGHLLASSRRGVPMLLTCDRDEDSCWGYDGALSALVLDPASFRKGSVVPGLNDDERSGLWSFEADKEDWGFEVRHASISEIAGAELALARRVPRPLALLVALGAVAATLAVVGVGRSRSRKWWRFGLWALSILLRVAGLGTLLLVALYCFLLVGFSLIAWFASLGLGASLILLPWWVMRQRKLVTPA